MWLLLLRGCTNITDESVVAIANKCGKLKKLTTSSGGHITMSDERRTLRAKGGLTDEELIPFLHGGLMKIDLR